MSFSLSFGHRWIEPGVGGIGEFYGNEFRFLDAMSATPGGLAVHAAGDIVFTTSSTSNEFLGPDWPVSYTRKYVLVGRPPCNDSAR